MNLIKDPLDELLKADAAARRGGYIDDAGFTLRVLDVLPRDARLPNALRIGIPLIAAIVAALFTAFFAGGGAFLVDAAMDIATQSVTASSIAFVAIVITLAAVAVAAIQDS